MEKEKNSKVQLEYLFHVNSIVQDLVLLLDAKAGAIIGATLALFAILINSPNIYEKIRHIFNTSSNSIFENKDLIIFLVYSIFSFFSIFSAAFVLYPRPARYNFRLYVPNLTFFESILNCFNPERYYQRVLELDNDLLIKEMCVQNFEISSLVRFKYNSLKVSLLCFFISLISWIVLIIKFIKM